MKLTLHLASFLAALCVSGHASAQSATCVSTYLAKRKIEPTLGITASDAERLVSRVAQSLALTRPVTVVPCTFAEKAYAWVGRPDDSSPEGEYIIYNPDWVREVLGKDEVQAVALFGHELGHFLNGDFTTRKGLPRSQLERDADRFAGCAVARLSGDFSRFEDLLSRLRLEKDVYYPDRLSSIQSAKDGFESCRGVQISSASPQAQLAGELPPINHFQLDSRDGIFCERNNVYKPFAPFFDSVDINIGACSGSEQFGSRTYRVEWQLAKPKATPFAERRGYDHCFASDFSEVAPKLIQSLQQSFAQLKDLVPCKVSIYAIRQIRLSYIDLRSQSREVAFLQFYNRGGTQRLEIEQVGTSNLARSDQMESLVQEPGGGVALDRLLEVARQYRYPGIPRAQR